MKITKIKTKNNRIKKATNIGRFYKKYVENI